MFEAVKPSLAGKKVALFGSYGWGGGEWMRTWESDCAAAGITLCAESVICQDEAGRRGAGRLRRAWRSFEVISKNGRAMRVHQPVEQKGYFRFAKVPFYDHKQLFKPPKKAVLVLPSCQFFRFMDANKRVS